MKFLVIVAKIMVALVILGIGLGIFGWGLAGVFWIPSLASVTIYDYLSTILLMALFYACCAAAFLLLLSTFANKSVVLSAGAILSQLYIICSALYLIIGSTAALHNGRMKVNEVNVPIMVAYGTLSVTLIAIMIYNWISSRRLPKQ